MSKASEPLSFSDNFFIDDNLRDIPKNPELVKQRVEYLESQVRETSSSDEQVKFYGEMGGLYRVLGQLELAEDFLQKALALVKENNLGQRMYVIFGIRLAHVWQWQKKFEKSNFLFERLLQICRQEKDCENLLDFTYQHQGKNFFDQGNYKRALECFSRALDIRVKRKNLDLIQSTEFAIQVTQKKLRP